MRRAQSFDHTVDLGCQLVCEVVPLTTSRRLGEAVGEVEGLASATQVHRGGHNGPDAGLESMGGHLAGPPGDILRVARWGASKTKSFVTTLPPGVGSSSNRSPEASKMRGADA